MRGHGFKPHRSPDLRGLSSGKTLDYVKFVRKVQEIYSDFMYFKFVLIKTNTSKFQQKKKKTNLERIPRILNEEVFKNSSLRYYCT